MVPFYRIIPQSASASQRLATIRGYYFFAVKYVNANYPRLGLRPYAIPPDADKKLEGLATDLTTLAELSQANVMLTVTSDQNLFENDQIHFAINVTPDLRYFQKGQVIAQLVIPGKSGASINIALIQLENYVSVTARRLHLPPFLSDTPTDAASSQTAQMQQTHRSARHLPADGLCRRRFLSSRRRHSNRDRADAAALLVTAVLGIDPGRSKAGYALLEASGDRRGSGIEPIAAARRLEALVTEHRDRAIALGRGTTGQGRRAAAQAGLPIHLVDEYETTRWARSLYFTEHPPRGWRRLVPIGLQLPPRPIDDYAAILIARRFLAERQTAEPASN